MNSKKLNEDRGFTLIELLAVIIILGVIMLIAIPSVTKYISSSRKKSYINTAREIISGARVMVNEGNLEMYDTDATYYIDASCVKTENAFSSPYGKFEKAYVVVVYDESGYKYYWTSVDEVGQGIPKIVLDDNLDVKYLESNVKVSDISTDRALGKRSKTILIDGENECHKQDAVAAVAHLSENGDGTDYYSGAICRRATVLSTEICPSGKPQGCNGTGYAAGSTVTFGSLGTSGVLTAGDAFDCDVNGDRRYDPETERFYFISYYYDTYNAVFDNNVAVLQYDRNLGRASDYTVSTWPQGALAVLPSTEDWPTVRLYKNQRRIDNLSSNGVNNRVHIQSFDYTGKAARLINYYEINNACTTMPWNSHRALDRCQYFLTNTNYAGGGACYSYENIIATNYVTAVIGNHSSGNTRMITNSNCAIRPAIEVPIDKMEY